MSKQKVVAAAIMGALGLGYGGWAMGPGGSTSEKDQSTTGYETASFSLAKGTSTLAAAFAFSNCRSLPGQCRGKCHLRSIEKWIDITSIRDTVNNDLRDPHREDTHHHTTVQIVTTPGFESDDGFFHFKIKKMSDLESWSGDVRKACPGLWRDFQSQPILEGRSGVLLSGGPHPIILTSAHGGGDLENMYAIITRTASQIGFKYDTEGRLVVPKKYVRKLDCVLDCNSEGSSDWMIFQAQGSRTDSWSGGLQLADTVSSGDPVIASFHPLGLPAKISDCATTTVINGVYSVEVDYAEGASGGAIINLKTGQLAGIARQADGLGSPEAGSMCIAAQRNYYPLRFTPSKYIKDQIGNNTNKCKLKKCVSN